MPPLTIEAYRRAFAKKEGSAVELIAQTLQQIKNWNPRINALLQVFEGAALAQAKQSDDRIQSGHARPLEGIPIAVKDNICVNQGNTTAGSRILENFKSPYDATAVKKLKDAGAIIIGKANLDEFAMGSSTEFSAFGPTKNPWDVTRVAGGSSGGSIAAVAAQCALGALGTDTGGSIRQPAGFCSVVGVKPTYGRVSRFGAIAYGSSLDQIGPVARTVKDAALLLEVIAGPDTYDATVSRAKVGQYAAACGRDIAGLTIGVPKEFIEAISHTGQRVVIKQAIKEIASQGARIKEISLPLTSAGIAVYYLIAKAEASTNLARFDGLRYGPMKLKAASLIERYMEARGQGFGPEVKRAILMGTYALSAGYYDAWYKQAGKVRTLIRREYDQAFAGVDAIVGPVSPEPAFLLGQKKDDPLAMYMADALTVPISVAGLPAISVPCGFTDDGLPVGLQIAAPHFKEETIFQIAHAYEQASQWWQQSPSESVQ